MTFGPAISYLSIYYFIIQDNFPVWTPKVINDSCVWQ